jgi:hypothetical protein
MKVGTKSILFGAHCFFIHPIFVFIAWWKLYGFPKDPRLWIAFIVHDWGYWGKPNMDGVEGETHVELGARIMHKVFDKKGRIVNIGREQTIMLADEKRWHEFTLYHSRFYAKKNNHPISRLCVADKYAIVIEPSWLYLFRATLSGEVKEYLQQQRIDNNTPFTNKKEWLIAVKIYLNKWVDEHKDNLNDSWTKVVPIDKSKIAEHTKNNPI